MKSIYTIIFAFTTLILHAQNYTLSGTVLDRYGYPLESANVFIKDLNKGASSDSRGFFEISNINQNELNLTISMVGYKTVERFVNLKASSYIRINLDLKSELIEQVTVQAMKATNPNRIVMSTNRLGIRNIDMPSSTGVLDKSLISNQQLLSLGEAISNVSGVFQFNKGYGGTSETFGARGVSLRYLGFMFRDGSRFGTNQSLATPELQNMERVEVFKGGAAINFGYVSPGATINYVTKKAGFYNGGYASLRLGSYSYVKPVIDYNTKLSDNLAVRFVATGDYGKSFRDNVDSRRLSGYVATKYRFSEKTEIDWNIDYLYDNRPRDFGLPIFEDRIITGTKTIKDKNGKDKKVNVYLQSSGRQRLYSKVTSKIRNTNIGGIYNNRNSNQLNSHLSLNTVLDDTWSLRFSSGGSFSGYDYLQSGSGFSNQYVLQGDDLLIKRTLEKQKWNENAFGMQANLVGKLKLFGLSDQLSISADYDNRIQNSDNFSRIRNFDQTYLFKGTQENIKVPEIEAAYEGVRKFSDIGFAVQNMLFLGDYVNFLSSIRVDKVFGLSQNTFLKDYHTRRGSYKKGDVVKTDFSDIAFTPALGLTIKATKTNSIFVSYTNSFNPNRNARLDEDDNILPPYYTKQFELGTKNDFANGLLSTNISYFYINDNAYVASPNVPDRYEIGPGTRYRGVETDLTIRPFTGMSLNANYTYLYARYNKGGFFKEGTRPQQTPEHQVGFAAMYKIPNGTLKNFSVSVNGQYTGERLGNDYYRGGTPYIQDAYTMLNLGLGYSMQNVDINLKVTNLLDEFVFFAYRFGSVNPIDPRMFAGTIQYNF